MDGAYIQGKRILLVKKRDTWILPGGKLEELESETDCLKREFGEELPNTRISIKGFYKAFNGITPFTKSEVLVKVFFIEVIGEDISSSAEISGSQFFTKEELSLIKISDITKEILDDLEKNSYL